MNFVYWSSRKRSKRRQVERARARRVKAGASNLRAGRGAGASRRLRTASCRLEPVSATALRRDSRILSGEKTERRSKREVRSRWTRLPESVLGRAPDRNRRRGALRSMRWSMSSNTCVGRLRGRASQCAALRQAAAAARLSPGPGRCRRVRGSRFSPVTADVQGPAQSGACKCPQESAPWSGAPVRLWSSSKPMSGIFSRTVNPAGVTSITAMSV